jgi:crossover junction endodeoxyribonuclease RuvC
VFHEGFFILPLCILLKLATNDRIILGIDPGTLVMGYGLVHIQNNKLSLIALGVIKLEKFDEHADRLKKIFERVVGLIDEYKPDELAIEAPFFGKNVQSMLKLGRAQGVAIAAALSKNIPMTEYSPKKIKMSVTGNGNASKQQVSSMLESLLNFKYEDKYLDATDALGAAVCHYFQNKTASSGIKKSYSGWDSFIKDNPNRKA